MHRQGDAFITVSLVLSTYAGRILISGVAAAVASALTAAACSRLGRRGPSAPLNAVSHIAWGGDPPSDPGPGGVNLATGFALHTGAAVFWAAPFELVFGRMARNNRLSALVGGATISIVAFITDYYIVGPRFRPGYEAYLSRRGLFGVYAALAAGLAIGTRLGRFGDHPPEDHHERAKGRNAQSGPERMVRHWAKSARPKG